MPNLLLTGPSGFVGSHIIKSLGSQFEIDALTTSDKEINGVRNQYKWSEIDKIEANYVAVIHAAGLAHDTQNNRLESEYFEVNEGLTKLLLSHAGKWEIQSFIYLSSIKAIFDSTASKTIDETVESTATHVYGRSKLAAEKAIQEHDSNFSKVILRPVMIYGKGQKGNLKTLEKWIRKGIIFPFGKWDNKRSVLSINNLTYCIQQIIDKPIPTGSYFIADDDAISTVEMLNAIGKGIHKKARFIGVPNSIIRFGLKLLPNKLKSITDKVLGSLTVDNKKLKTALHINQMPFQTSTELPAAITKD